MITSCPSKKDPVNSFIHSSIFHLLILNSQDILEDSSRVNFLSVDFIDYNGFLVTGVFTDFEILDCCSFGGWIFAFSLFYYLLLPSFPRSSFLPDLLRMSDDFMRCRIPNPLVMVNFICQFRWAMGPRYVVSHFPDVLGGCFWMRLASPLSLSALSPRTPSFPGIVNASPSLQKHRLFRGARLFTWAHVLSRAWLQ